MSNSNKKEKGVNAPEKLNPRGKNNDRLADEQPLAEARLAADNGVSYIARIRFGLARVLHLTDRVADRIITAYDRLFSLDDGETARIYMDMGTDFAHEGNCDDALAALSMTLEMQPDNGNAWFQVGLIHLERQDSETAVEAFKKAKTLGNLSFEVHCQLADAFADLGNHEAASKELKRAVELDPNSAESFFSLGVALDNLKKYEEASEAFHKAIDLSPREPVYYQSLGFTMGSLKRHDLAITYIKRAVELERRRSR